MILLSYIATAEKYDWSIFKRNVFHLLLFLYGRCICVVYGVHLLTIQYWYLTTITQLLCYVIIIILKAINVLKTFSNIYTTVVTRV